MPTGDLKRNPYVCGHPVEGEDFFGRRDELSRILSQLERGGHYCIYGAPNSGKTSLLNGLSSADLGEQVVVCYCDLARLPQDTTLGEYLDQQLRRALEARAASSDSNVFGAVLEKFDKFDPEGNVRKVAGQALGKLVKGLKQAWDQIPTGATAVKGPEGLSLLERSFNRLKEQGLSPILLVDDAEPLFAPREDKDTYFKLLEAMLNEGLTRLVMTLSPQSESLTAPLPETLHLHLGVLPTPEARQLFTEPARRAGLEFAEEWFVEATSFVGRHPYLLQIYAFHLFSRLQSEALDQPQLEREVRRASTKVVEGLLDSLTLDQLGWLKKREPQSGSELRLVLQALGVVDSEGNELPVFEGHLGAAPTKSADQAAEPSAAESNSGEVAERSLLEVIEERMRLDTYLRERFTQVATFVDIDVVGSTALKQGEDEFSVIYSFEEYHRWQKAKIEEGGGRLLNAIGDETMSMFDEPEQAINAIRAMLNDLSEFNRSDANRLRGDFQFRAGVHLGEVIRDVKEERAYSHVLDLAGHLQKMAPKGSLAVSQLVYEALGKPEYLEPWEFNERDSMMTFRLKEGA